MRTMGQIAVVATVDSAGVAQWQETKADDLSNPTGLTADVGKPFAAGVRDAVAWTNANGGINGKKIKLVDADYGYKVPEGVALYKRFVNDEKVVLMQAWGTGDTEALKDVVTKDQMPYFSASFSAHLTDPNKTPYNFFVPPSYSDALRAWLLWVKEDWKDRSRNPRVAFFYGDNAYGKSPIEAGRRFAKEIGVDLVDEEILPGVGLRYTGGHTDGHQVIEMDGGADRAVFFGDLVPTAWHLPPAYTMAYDLHPQQVLTRKRELLEELSAQSGACFLYHDPDPRPGRLRREGRRFVVDRLGA